MDGWWKASNSMKAYIKEMFPANGDTPWWEHIDAIPEDSSVIETYIVQRVDAQGHVQTVDIGHGNMQYLTIIIKRENRRKHNSHEWFFQSYCPAYNAEYAFATDCGTLYADKCLIHLLSYMDTHPECAASTGRQRVMSAAMQGSEGEGFLSMWYRAAQAYDYEASISSFQGAFSLVGMLPVLPGPCGLYRMSDIAGDCLNYYFDTVNIRPDETGMVTGNLLLAEDRILSYAAALKTGKFTMWVPHAVFYFEAETDSGRFIAQRRRWTNGSFAGYIYLIVTNPGLLIHAPHTWYFKVSAVFLLFLQLLMFMLVSISPAIFMSMAFYAVYATGFLPQTAATITQYTVLSIYIILYLAFITMHSRNKFVPWLYYLALFTNALFLVFILAAIIVAIIFGDKGVLAVVLLVMFTPFLLSFLHSTDSLVLMLTTFFPFMFFLPTFVAWFAAYAFSRTWDLTWGNRPSDQMDSISKEKRDEKMKHMKRVGMGINYALALANVGLGLVLCHGPKLSDFIWISLAVASPSIIQMALSLVFYLLYTPHYGSSLIWQVFDRSAHRVAGTVCTLLTFVLLCVSLTSSNWLTRPGTMTLPSNSTQPYYAHFGLLNTCVDVPQGVYDPNLGRYTIYPGSYCGTYGTQLIEDWPHPIFSLCLVLLVLACAFSAISLVAMTMGAVTVDKSRHDGISSLYMSVSSFQILFVIFLFPFGWENMGVNRTGGVYGYISDQGLLCGPDQAIYNPGSCTVSYSYILLIFSFFGAVIASYCFKAMRKHKTVAQAIVKANRGKTRAMSEVKQTQVMAARLQRLEELILRAKIVQEIILEDDEEEMLAKEKDDIQLC